MRSCCTPSPPALQKKMFYFFKYFLQYLMARIANNQQRREIASAVSDFSLANCDFEMNKGMLDLGVFDKYSRNRVGEMFRWGRTCLTRVDFVWIQLRGGSSWEMICTSIATSFLRGARTICFATLKACVFVRDWNTFRSLNAAIGAGVIVSVIRIASAV